MVLKLDKSGGCVDRDDSFMRQLRQSQVREYFFGDAKNSLSPHTQQIDFSQVVIYRIAESKLILPKVIPDSGLLMNQSKPPHYLLHFFPAAKQMSHQLL